MLNSINDDFIKILPIFISTISLLISILTLFLNRKHLDVVIENNLDSIEDLYFNILDYNSNKPSLSFGKGKVCFIKIVNPSPKDIAFFDLRVVDIKSMTPVFFLTKAVLDLTRCENKTLFYQSNNILARLNIPDSNYGVLKSNSFTRLEVAFFPESQNSQILISFKVAIPSLIRNKESTDRRKFKYYKKIYTITY